MAQDNPQNSEKQEPMASVALIFVENEEPEFLIIERAKHPNDPWSGHLALPGGRKDPRDESLLDTCIRETREETGIVLPKDSLLGQLPDSSAGSRDHFHMLVCPFVFEMNVKPGLVLDPKEVTQAFWVPQSILLNPEEHKMQKTLKSWPQMEFPSINIREKILWGFTYGVFGLYFDHIKKPHPFLKNPRR